MALGKSDLPLARQKTGGYNELT